MFEVGFTEIVLIFGIALLVLGPARLPKLAADLGRWAGRARAMARTLRTQLEQEVQFDPLASNTPTTRSTPGQGTIHTPHTPPSPPAPAPADAQAADTPTEPAAMSTSTEAAAESVADTDPTPTTQTVPDERQPG
jgi:sec-independent protein translocase protein TatB